MEHHNLGAGSIIKIKTLTKKGIMDEVKAVISHRNEAGEYFVLTHADNADAFLPHYIKPASIKEVIYKKSITKGEHNEKGNKG